MLGWNPGGRPCGEAADAAGDEVANMAAERAAGRARGLADLLLRSGADPTCLDQNGKTAAELAAFLGLCKLATALAPPLTAGHPPRVQSVTSLVVSEHPAPLAPVLARPHHWSATTRTASKAVRSLEHWPCEWLQHGGTHTRPGMAGKAIWPPLSMPPNW